MKSLAVSFYGNAVSGTDFGVMMVEDKDFLAVSLRKRTDVDVSIIAEELGGGGHPVAAAARIYDMPFSEAVDKVLMVARKYARKN